MSFRPRFPVVLFVLCLSTLMVSAQDEAKSPKAGKKATNNLYIVQTADAPAISYTGGVAGLAATKPRKGQKLDPASAEVLAYTAYLNGKHDQAVAKVNGRKVADYNIAFNGFAAELSPSQADALKTASGVLTVSRDELLSADTVSTPKFLGISEPGGLWEQLGGVGNAGEDMIIGVIDSGIWPENPAFSDRTGLNGSGNQDDKLAYQHMPVWHGSCHPGEQFPASLCNQKLIGAYHFNIGWGGDAALKALRPWEYMSPRGFHGHGSHTSSTAGGNNGVKLPGALSPFGAITGMAPRARLAMYKALYFDDSDGSANGFSTDFVAAIDQAVADGVDVLNFSVGGTRTNFVDPVQVAYLNAANAGIFVAASAGNSGDTIGDSSVAHPGPWLTTVAAGTHNRNGEGSVTVNGVIYAGASYATAISGNLVDASTAGLPGVDPANAARCFAA